MNAEIKEANRYVAYAKEILSEKTDRVNGAYTDKKYVRMAGHTAYMGVLHALDQLIIHPSNKPRRKSVEFYQIELSKYDKKMLSEFNILYDLLHLSLGYDGMLDSVVVIRGMTLAKDFIQKIAARLN